MVAFKYERRIRHGREGIDRSEGNGIRKNAHQFQTNDIFIIDTFLSSYISTFVISRERARCKRTG